jgi:hypothetical protein
MLNFIDSVQGADDAIFYYFISDVTGVRLQFEEPAIAAKEDVDMDQVETGTGSTRTSVYGSISGGSSGSRISIGLGFLLGGFSSGSSEPEPVRYEVDLVDGGQMTIYHDSKDFEVGDCVKITVHPDEKKYPPTMKRNKGGC